MSKLALILKTTTKTGKRDEVRSLFDKHLMAHLMEDKKQEVLVWVDDNSNPNVFYLFEIYTDMEAMQANGQTPWFAAYMQEAMPLIEQTGSEMMMGMPRFAKGVIV